MTRLLFAVAWTLAVGPALAGCAAPPGPQAQGVPPDADARDPALQFTSCAGWQLTAIYPMATHPGHTPPEWAPGPEVLVGTVDAQGWTCERVKVGPFERGPVNVLFETHTKQRVTGACASANEVTFVQQLERLWIDDPEVGAFLSRHHGMPVQVADFHVVRDEADGVTRLAWTWDNAGGPSSAQAYDAGERAAEPALPLRLFWQGAAGASSLDLRFTVQGPAQGDRLAFGSFSAPMLLADRPLVASPGQVLEGDFSGQLREFGDMSCERQVWP